MNEQGGQTNALQARTSASDTPMAEWLERVADVPDLRMAKVMRLRRAINSQSYDEGAIIDKVLSLVENEVGVLSRRDLLVD